MQLGERCLFWEQDHMARSGESGRSGGREAAGQAKGEGGLPALHSRGKQAWGSRGKHGHQAALPALVPSLCGCVPRPSLCPHFLQLPFPPHPIGVREVTAGILITPVKPNPPFVQTSELSQKPRPLGPRTEGADAAVSAFPERMPGLPWQVSMNSHFLRHLWGVSGCDSPSPAPPG